MNGLTAAAQEIKGMADELAAHNQMMDAKDELRRLEGFLEGLKAVGDPIYEKHRCKKHRDVMFDIEYRIHLLRGIVMPAVTPEQEAAAAKAMAAWDRDTEIARAQGYNCD
jgi:hypothetical protein